MRNAIGKENRCSGLNTPKLPSPTDPKQQPTINLGSRSALEWVLDQYKERKPRDPTIAEWFNTYRFADYKEQVIDLLRRVCTVSVKTVEIVGRMGRIERVQTSGGQTSERHSKAQVL